MSDSYCCEEHFPSEAMTPEERAAHFCPVCGAQGSGDDLSQSAPTDADPEPASLSIGPEKDHV